MQEFKHELIQFVLDYDISAVAEAKIQWWSSACVVVAIIAICMIIATVILRALIINDIMDFNPWLLFMLTLFVTLMLGIMLACFMWNVYSWQTDPYSTLINALCDAL